MTSWKAYRWAAFSAACCRYCTARSTSHPLEVYRQLSSNLAVRVPYPASSRAPMRRWPLHPPRRR